jgi:hypothetical protein
MPILEVSITKNSNQFVPSQDPVTLSKQHGHSVQWHNDTQEQITINFGTATPFAKQMNPYKIDPGKSGHSGPIEGAVGTWKYNIEGASGDITDPEIIIQE